MQAGIIRGFCRSILLPPFLGLLAACSVAEERIGSSNQGMLLWAVEIVTTEPMDRLFSSSIAPYQMVPGVLPLAAGKLPADGEAVEVEPIRLRPAEEIVLRSQNTQVFWYATPVFGTDIFALAFFAEHGFFQRSHFATSQRIPIAPELNPASDPRVYQITPDVPLFQVQQGEAVYIGTFTATLSPGTRTFAGDRRIRRVQRSYRIEQRDAEGIVAELGLAPDRLRYVDVFRDKNEALRRYRGAVISQ